MEPYLSVEARDEPARASRCLHTAAWVDNYASMGLPPSWTSLPPGADPEPLPRLLATAESRRTT